MCVYSELDALSNQLTSSSVEGCELVPSLKELLEPMLCIIFKAFGTRLGKSSRRGLKDSSDARLKNERMEMRKMNDGRDKTIRLRLYTRV